MKVNVIYQSGSTAYQLLENLKIMGCTMVCSEFRLAGEKYLNIELQTNSKKRRILNTPSVISSLDDPSNLNGILKVNKVAFSLTETESINRIYEVFVFDLDIIFIKMKSYDHEKEKAKYVRQADHSRIAETATRVLVLAGLDFALVTIAMTSRRRLRVIGINPSPELRDKDISRMASQIKIIYDADENNIKLGADPEFMLVNTKTGKMVAASRFFPKDGEIGCDHIRIPNRQQRPIAEIRPRPEKNPRDLVQNIKRGLEGAARMAPYRNVKWVAGSQPFSGYSIGGHIHFSNIRINAALIRVLDNYLGIPVFLIENPSTAARRRKRYGLLGEYRIKAYGGFEYRTPGSWLISQEIATATLMLAKVLADNYSSLRNNYLNNEEAQEAFYAGDQQYFLNIFDVIWGEIKRLEDYPSYAKDIELINWMISNRITWDEKNDIRKSWKLNPDRIKRERRSMENSDEQRGFANRGSNNTETINSNRRTATASSPATGTSGRIITNNSSPGNRSINRHIQSYRVDARAGGNSNTQTSGTITASHQVRRARPVR